MEKCSRFKNHIGLPGRHVWCFSNNEMVNVGLIRRLKSVYECSCGAKQIRSYKKSNEKEGQK